MPDRQRKFELIPTTLVNSDGPRRPMTSKAAKKAYQQKNRGPRVSRVEQRRLEAEELARQKKDYEKERAAIKSKAAREKKAAKLQAEKEERKRQGLPEPSKFVRASQPTISRFVVDGSKRSWQQMESVAEDSDDMINAPEDAGSPAKRAPKAPKRAMADDESEDEFGDFPSFSQLPALFEKIDSSANNSQEAKSNSQQLPTREPVTAKPTEQGFEDEDALADIQLLSEAAEAQAAKCDIPHQSKPPTKFPYSPPHNVNQNQPALDEPSHTKPKPPVIPRTVLHDRSTNISPPKTVISRSEKSISSLKSLQEQSNRMPPPRGPIRRPSKSLPFTPPPPKSKAPPFKPKRPQNPSSATQAFLESHLDDFFPSPSQQVRELLDDLDDLPSNTQIAREISPVNEVPATPKVTRELNRMKEVEDDPFDLICTQDLVLSPQDLLEIETLRKPTVEKRKQPPQPRQPPVSMQRRRFFEEKEEDLLHAALHESTVMIVQKVPEMSMPAAQAPDPAKRRLQRIPSTITDYGDEEFEEQELFALF